MKFKNAPDHRGEALKRSSMWPWRNKIKHRLFERAASEPCKAAASMSVYKTYSVVMVLDRVLSFPAVLGN